MLAVEHGRNLDGSIYFNNGFLFDDTVAYIGDYNALPSHTLDALLTRRPRALILDASASLSTSFAHAGLPSAFLLAQQLPHSRIYLTGINHCHSHDDWLAACALVSGEALTPKLMANADPNFLRDALAAVDTVSVTDKVWLRPTFDGLRLAVSRTDVRDGCYDA